MIETFGEIGTMLPQPPEGVVQDNPGLDLRPFVAVENLCAGTNTELKCMILAGLPNEEIAVKDIKELIAGLSAEPYMAPPLSHVRATIGSYLPLGVTEYDQETDTTRAVADNSELAIAFARLMLKGSLETGISISTLIPRSEHQHSWEGFTNLGLVKRLPVLSKIAKFRGRGTQTGELKEYFESYSFPLTGEYLHGLTQRMGNAGLMEVDKAPGRRSHTFSLGADMRNAVSRVGKIFEVMQASKDVLLELGNCAVNQVLTSDAVPRLLESMTASSGRTGNPRLAEIQRRCYIQIVGAKEKPTARYLFDTVGLQLGYGTFNSFRTTLFESTRKLSDDEIYVLPDDTQGERNRPWIAAR